ncbi:MAG: hypothetical protein EPN20_08430 [Magnetospirillum sp.]|nr:MAG: hypothetical protein EPN20_08430 [Magnetospirillum sp.]
MTNPHVVHSLAEARAVMAARDVGEAVTLESPPAAAGYHGIGWWRALVTALTEEFPDREIKAVLDCGSAPGHALAALRAGVKSVRIDAPAETLAALTEIAAALGAAIQQKKPSFRREA